MRVLVSDRIAQDGLEILEASAAVDVNTGLDEDGLVDVIGDYDALIVRSGTKVTARVIEAADRLRVVGRAGVGVDNIDLDAATQRGILVVNAPDGNSLAAAEHSIALMLSLARHIPQADASMRRGHWDRKRFMGTGVTGKTLGVVGLGRIGQQVARRARGLEMHVVAHDPYVSAEYAQGMGIELCAMDELLRRADFLTVHVPLTPATKGLIGAQELALLKPTACVINCARGGVIDEEALAEALVHDQMAGAALDVFVEEPPKNAVLLQSEKTVLTPHLGASTTEAQVAVAVDVVQEVLSVLEGRSPTHPVNAPLIPPEAEAQVLPFCELAEKIGHAAAQLVDRRLDHVHVTYAGQLADYNTDPLRALLIKGLLEDVTETRITLVNANLVARERGLSLVEEKTGAVESFASTITLSFEDDGQERVLVGTVLRGEPHLVQIDAYPLDFVLKGHQLLIYHHDRPGLIGQVGDFTGDADINIAFMGVGRLEKRGQAWMVLTLDEPASADVIAGIEALDDIYATRQLEL